MPDPAKPAPVKGPASYFPSIEKTYGKPMAHWLALVAAMGDRRHMEKVAIDRAEYGNRQEQEIVRNLWIKAARGNLSRTEASRAFDRLYKPYD